jgi:hypothetical protein
LFCPRNRGLFLSPVIASLTEYELASRHILVNWYLITTPVTLPATAILAAIPKGILFPTVHALKHNQPPKLKKSTVTNAIRKAINNVLNVISQMNLRLALSFCFSL